MKIKRLIVSPRSITNTIRREQRIASEVMTIDGRLEVENVFLTIPSILDDITVDERGNISRRSIKDAVARHGYFNIHLVLSEEDWEKLGLRKDLYGQSEVVGGQAITYGRWSQRSRYKFVKNIVGKYTYKGRKYPLNKIPEASLGAWHELDHCVRNMLSKRYVPTTHWYFYGYAKKYISMDKYQQAKVKPRRFVRTPNPYIGWRILPFHKLEKTVTRVQLLEKEKGLLERIVSLYALLIRKQSPKIDTLQPAVARIADELVKTMARKGHAVIVTDGYRSIAEQNRLYAKGRTVKGRIVTNARGGYSYHNYGIAFDVAFLVRGKPSWSLKHDWELLGRTGEELGLEWGGRWGNPDRPHFQMRQGYTINDFVRGLVDYQKYK